MKPKLAFIGRQYHSKTKSDQTIISILEQEYEVHVIRRELFTDSELVNQVNQVSPQAIFFWCLPPSTTKHLWKMQCKNVIWAPMWDGFKPLKFRKRMLIRSSKVRVLCFSHALYRYFQKTHIEAKYVQCFLKPHFTSFKDKPPYTLFLWQREAMINLDHMVQLLGEENIGKVLYKSEIGSYPHKSYSFEIEKLNDWMSREEYLTKIEEADFFVAPRKSEGIGFSFLEPMSLGKVILGYDESTMNEYLVEGENGYLFDSQFKLRSPLKSPKELSEKMLEHAQNYHQKWEETQTEILPFIRGEVLCKR